MTDEQKIWDILLEKLGNPYGTAAVMGSFFIESKLNPKLLQSSYAKKLGMTSEEYTQKTDSGEYPAKSFANDKAGYGLAQWTFWSRKAALLNFSVLKGVSVGDLDMQLEFFCNEVQSYKTAFKALTTATNVKDASDVFTKRYEQPADVSEKALKRRSDKAQEYFDKYASVTPVPKQKFVRATANNVNVRTGPNKSDPSVGRVKKDTMFQYYGTDENGWNGVVLWLHPDFSEVVEI